MDPDTWDGEQNEAKDGDGEPRDGGDDQAETNESASERRKRDRQLRRERKKELMRVKPAEDADDPRDVEAIRYAKSNMGDYKLKSDPNYIVPEDQVR